MIYRVYVFDPAIKTIRDDTKTTTVSAEAAIIAFSELIQDARFFGSRAEINFSARNHLNKKTHIACHYYDAPEASPDNWTGRAAEIRDFIRTTLEQDDHAKNA